MTLNKKQINWLKDLEIKLHYAHEAIREFNKDIHCDDGQEYPVPYARFTNNNKPLDISGEKKREYIKETK